MKRLLFTLFFISTINLAIGQTVTYGIKAGLNFAQLSYGANPFVHYTSKSPVVGFNVGAIADIGFKGISIQPGIFYSMKGGESSGVVNLGGNTGNITGKTVLNYIEVPVNVLYKYRIRNGMMIDLGGGPYIGYGISQTLSATGGSDDLFLKSHTFGYKNPDWGINFVASIEMKKFIVGASYGFGFGNLAAYSSMHNRVTSLSVGYMFR